MIKIEDKKKFAEEVIVPLLLWYDKNKRILPWRENTDPYRVWLSEIMLQQTRVEAVKPYFERFTGELPDVQSLATVPEEKLLKLWEGLGYYNRARNLQKAAAMVVSEYDGRMPDTYERLLTLPGIGSYTAGAVASISFQRPVPAVDGNVMRIMTRLYEDDTDIMLASFKKELEQALTQVMPTDRPGDFNQALMELGATVCLPNGKPLCDVCPLHAVCRARMHGSWDRLPVKTPKKKRREEKRTILLIRDGENILIHKRPDKGLLAGLYEFVNLEGHLEQQEIEQYVKQLGLSPLYIRPLEDSIHIFSHIEWQMQGYLIRIEDVSFDASDSLSRLRQDGYELVLSKEIEKDYAIPSAFRTYTQYANITIGIS